MGSISSIIIGLLAVSAAGAGYSRTNNYTVAILAAVAMVLIGKALQPAVLALYSMFEQRFFPLPELKEIHEKKLHPTEDYTIPPQTQGVRVLVMTENLAVDEKTKPLYLEMVQQALDGLCEESPLFALRLRAAMRRDLPEQYVCSLCGTEGENMRKCVRAWLGSDAVREMKARTQNKDLFLRDGSIAVEGEEKPVRYTVMVLFDCDLPVTLPSTSGETAENQG